MKMTPSIAAAASAAAALAVAGITYAAFAPGSAAQAVPVVQQAAAPAPAPGDGDAARGNEGREREEEGRIEINEREYSAHQSGCVTVISGLGAKTLNIRNESHHTIEIFDGVVCDSGAPIATVAPRSTSEGVKTEPTEGIWVEHGVVASFRVIQHHEGHSRMPR